jgi:hypothetical protein
VRLGEPISVEGLSTAARDDVLNRARREILELMDPRDAAPSAGISSSTSTSTSTSRENTE